MPFFVLGLAFLQVLRKCLAYMHGADDTAAVAKGVRSASRSSEQKYSFVGCCCGLLVVVVVIGFWDCDSSAPAGAFPVG